LSDIELETRQAVWEIHEDYTTPASLRYDRLEQTLGHEIQTPEWFLHSHLAVFQVTLAGTEIQIGLH